MYENVQPSQKPRDSRILYIWLTVCILVMLLILGLFFWAFHYKAEYRTFVSDLSNSTYYAYQNGCMQLQIDGAERPILPKNTYEIYNKIVNVGIGQTEKPPETQPDAVLDYGDGSYLELWKVELETWTVTPMYGVLLNYVNPKGEQYSCMLDRLELDELPLQPWQNLPDKLK